MSNSIITALAGIMSCAFLIGSYLSAPSTQAFRPTSHPRFPIPTAAQAAAAPGKIAFASDRDGNFEIYAMDADGGGQTRLTEDAGARLSAAPPKADLRDWI